MDLIKIHRTALNDLEKHTLTKQEEE